eukprot:98331-Rhodomonas_salina.1
MSLSARSDAEVSGRSEVLVSRLKASVAEEAPTAGGRRDVLLTLLGGMLSWGGCVQEVGLLVSQEMTGAMARASLAFLGKLKVTPPLQRGEAGKVARGGGGEGFCGDAK